MKQPDAENRPSEPLDFEAKYVRRCLELYGYVEQMDLENPLLAPAFGEAIIGYFTATSEYYHSLGDNSRGAMANYASEQVRRSLSRRSHTDLANFWDTMRRHCTVYRDIFPLHVPPLPSKAPAVVHAELGRYFAEVLQNPL